MRRNFTWARPPLGLAAAGLAAALTLAGCGGGGSSSAGGGATPGGGLPSGLPTSLPSGGLSAVASAAASAVAGAAGGSMKSSPLYGLTKLSKSQLCGVLSGSEAASILGTSTIAPQYANRFGLGITCEWMKSQGSSTELYVGLSTIIDWQGAQAIDKLLKTTPATIDGHPALEAAPQGITSYALVHVALGGAHDPTVEYRAPTMAIAVKLAQTVTPRLLALH
ncbi:MAG TPA: hypothetical protein VMV17_04395 [Streptosporangiaceae bacterium]|nr:hypothetical protein [Streptosporangiaceae bacterium]